MNLADADTIVPMHDHPHEQITMVEKGRVQFTIAGKVSVVGEGDVLHFAPGVLHGATGGWTAPFAVLIGVLAMMLLGGALAAAAHSVEDELERAGKLDG